MYEFARPLNDLIEQLRRIPGVGAKTAQRMAFHILAMPEADALQLAESIRLVKSRIFTCSRCNAITHVDPCETCSDPSRSDDALCVVEEPFNIASIEKTGSFRGRYHVLMGALSPLKGKGPDEVGVDKLVARVEAGSFKEIIIATNPTVEGEATAHYLAQLARRHAVRPSRLAHGVPLGGELEYIDRGTLAHAFGSRQEVAP